MFIGISIVTDPKLRCQLYDSGCGSGSGLYSGGLTWSIVLRCDDHTGILTCDGCARDPYFYVPAETQSYVIKLSCSRKGGMGDTVLILNCILRNSYCTQSSREGDVSPTLVVGLIKECACNTFQPNIM